MLCEILQLQSSLQQFMRTYFVNKIIQYVHICMHAYIHYMLCACIYLYTYIHCICTNPRGIVGSRVFLHFLAIWGAAFLLHRSCTLFVSPDTDQRATCPNPATNSEARLRVSSITYWFQGRGLTLCLTLFLSHLTKIKIFITKKPPDFSSLRQEPGR